ncbi:MAG: polysaccharide biosynthesis/export protein VpsN [Chthoniobacter sp.]|jgi:polysaccharide export outer membrane protein|nr:polysaccharide biosynthesis/export protein VpsN [Chthoniobacter sp.]
MRLFLLPLLMLSSFIADGWSQTIATLRSGDIFEMRLGGVPAEFAQDFNSQYTVSQEGSINVPLIGEMRAVGLTPTQLEKSLQTKLVAEKLFTHPAVSINLVQNNRYISVGGGVKQPGRQLWSTDLTLNSAINNAGGLDDFASPKGIRLIRENQVTLFNIKDIEKNPASDPKLLPGDQVIVRK